MKRGTWQLISEHEAAMAVAAEAIAAKQLWKLLPMLERGSV